ncbi:hypothetical protein KP509_01G059700 [Ceratopteris richardii]|uniref:Uncharacterized protein n=1 Tax=Ceratopteris richardii TaxID=49495 RepID=A0A8T2VL51_CERRI|nr:hypothetical protein KP509_01G059700 [Ceratopteris richardii]
MNSRNKSDNAQRAAVSFNNVDFDFGLGSAFSKASGANRLNAQKEQTAAPSNNYRGGGAGGASWAQKPVSSSPVSSSTSSSWTWSSSSTSSSSSSSATSWTWQSSGSGGGLHAAPLSMVGDITGKSWGSMDSTSKGVNNKSGLIGGLNKGASSDLFGDLWGGSRSDISSHDSTKSQPKASDQGQKSSAFSNLDAMSASLPRRVAMKDMKNSKVNQTDEMGDFVSADESVKLNSQEASWAAFEAFSSSKPSSDHSRKPSQNKMSEDPFGDFQSIPSVNTRTPAGSININTSAPTSHVSRSSSTGSDDFFSFASAATGRAPASKKGDSSGFSNSIDVDPFAFLGNTNVTPSPPINTRSVQSDPLESVFGKISTSTPSQKQADPVLDSLWGSAKSQPELSTQNVPDDWGVETGFGGDAFTETTTTTDLDGLSKPPPGVSGALSKDKGLEYYKQGQFSDAIKWLSWAEALLEQHGESGQLIEVLVCRSSCLKESGEYKKAVADCTKVIELENGNTSVLLQRALLYESMEKYKLGIADLKEVLKREPQNKVAINTLARLKKLGD